MSHFYGVLRGARGGATRYGSVKSGMVGQVASWQGAVRVQMWNTDGKDMVHVSFVPWRGVGPVRVLYAGLFPKT